MLDFGGKPLDTRGRLSTFSQGFFFVLPTLRDREMEAPTGNQVHVWENTYIMEPKDEEKFLPSKVTEIIESALTEKLKDKEYNAEDSKQWTLELCNEIKQSVKELDIPRYRVIVQVVIGENSGQGIRVASKCLWDTSADNWASFSYKNPSLFAVAMVFGCYYE